MKTNREKLLEIVEMQRFNKITNRDMRDIVMLYRLYISIKHGFYRELYDH